MRTWSYFSEIVNRFIWWLFGGLKFNRMAVKHGLGEYVSFLREGVLIVSNKFRQTMAAQKNVMGSLFVACLA